MITYKVPGDMDKVTAEAFLKSRLPAREAERLLSEGKVRMLPFFRAVDRFAPLARGSRVALLTDRAAEAFFRPLEIAYEDEEFLVVNKPQGMLCIEEGAQGRNLYRMAAEHMKNEGEYAVRSLHVPYVCNVLPREMGGLVIVAKEQFLFEQMLAALKERRIKRVYRAIVTGEAQDEALLYGFLEPGHGLARAALQEQSNRNTRPAALRYRRVETRGELSLIEVEPMSFLKQQIPLQLAAAGLPILGDGQYGSRAANRRFGIDCPAVWANRIVFETGRSNPMEYLNGKEICASTVQMPGIGYFTDRAAEVVRRVEPLNKKQLSQAAHLLAEVAKAAGDKPPAAFTDACKPGALRRQAEDGRLRLFGCFGPEGLEGVLGLSAEGTACLFCVREAARGKGVGREMLDFAAAQAGEGKPLTVYAAPGAEAFFAHMGFAAVGEETWAGATWRVMRREAATAK